MLRRWWGWFLLGLQTWVLPWLVRCHVCGKSVRRLNKELPALTNIRGSKQAQERAVAKRVLHVTPTKPPLVMCNTCVPSARGRRKK